MHWLTIPTALAQATITISSAIPGLNVNGNNAAPGAFVANFYQFALLLGGILAFGAIIYGGVLHIISAGNPSKQSEGKQWIWSALGGLLLLGGAYIILNTINPQLLNLSLPTLGAISTPTTTPGIGTTTGVPGVTGNLAGLQNLTVTALNNLESGCTQQSGHTCSVYITAGTNGAHSAAGTCTHGNGCKADLAPNSDVDQYITSLPRANPAVRGDGAPLYQAPDGAIYADERVRPSNCGANCQWTGAHWDMANH